jgi:hypothetical protein
MHRARLILFVFILFIGACKPATTAIPFTPTVEETEPTPSFTSDSGALRIKMQYADGSGPVSDQVFYLAEWLPVPDMPDSGVPALDIHNAPGAVSNENGVVVFSNVPPKRYSLVHFLPTISALVPDASTSKDLFVDIEAGKVVDLGSIRVTLDHIELETTTPYP